MMISLEDSLCQLVTGINEYMEYIAFQEVGRSCICVYLLPSLWWLLQLYSHLARSIKKLF